MCVHPLQFSCDALRPGRATRVTNLESGLGVHFCMGSRLAEIQLRFLCEEILVRFRNAELVGMP